MPAGDRSGFHPADPVSRADVAQADFGSLFRVVQAGANLAADPHAPDLQGQRQVVAGMILTKVKVFVAHDAAVGDFGNHPGHQVLFGDKAAAFEHAGDLGRSDLIGVQGVLKAQGRHFHRRNRAVRQDIDLFHAGPAAHDRMVGHPVVEHIPLTVQAGDRAVVVPGRIIDPVVDDVSPVGKGTPGRGGSGVGQAAAPAGRIDQVIGVPDFPGRAGLKKAPLLRDFLPVIDHALLQRAGDHIAHGGRVQLVHERVFKAVIYIDLAVRIHQDAGVVEDPVIPDLVGIPVLGKQAERPFRAVGYAHRSLRADDVGVKIIFSILFDHVRSVEAVVRPGRIRRPLFARAGAEAVPVALPFVQVVQRGGPDLQLVIAEGVSGRPVMGAVEIDPVPEHAGLPVRDVFPQGQNRIGHNVPPSAQQPVIKETGTRTAPGGLEGPLPLQV